MKRAFLIAYVLFLILASAAVQKCLYAMPGDAAWDWREAIPNALFSAGEIHVSLALAAQLLLCYERLSGRRPLGITPRQAHELLGTGLWCGWGTLACCVSAYPLVFPVLHESLRWLFPVENGSHAIMVDNPLLLLDAYTVLNVAGAVIMALYYAYGAALREQRRLQIAAAILTLLLALVAGTMWHGFLLSPLLFLMGACTLPTVHWLLAAQFKRAALAGALVLALAFGGCALRSPALGGINTLSGILVALLCLAGLSAMRLLPRRA